MSVHIQPLKESEIFTALVQNDYLGQKKKRKQDFRGGKRLQGTFVTITLWELFPNTDHINSWLNWDWCFGGFFLSPCVFLLV